jgi:hypothetical protein
METSKQISVALENKPGRLANALSALAHEKINIIAMTVMDSHEHSVLRLITNDVAKTVRVLNELGARHTETEVVVVELRNQPGALAHVCEQLAESHINIDYAYCSSGGRNGRTVGIFKVSDTSKALRLLAAGAPRRTERRPLRDRRAYQPSGNAAR